MKTIFPDPAAHPEWIQPHSDAWYAALDKTVGIYKYPWKSTFDEPTAETILKEELSTMLTRESRVLDVGCGHGEFTAFWTEVCREVIGIDNREKFIETARSRYGRTDNIRFLMVDAGDLLPFPDHYFDVVYTKRDLGSTGKVREF